MKNNKDFYRAFEEKHRGSRELIKERVSVYLPFVLPLKNLYPNVKALDIGCGRGEWLELLNENSMSAKGIDLDQGMLEACNVLSLDVTQGNGISYFKELSDESLTVVSAFHLVEHISFEDLQSLVQESLRVLKPGGILILETPNPENIKVATENFYVDPTHIKPIPSNLLSFLPEFYGYTRTKVLRLQESKELAGKESVNLLQVIEGASPDYAVVAQKEANQEILKKFDEIFAKDFGLPLSSLTAKFENRLLNIEKKASQAEAKASQAEAKASQTEAKASRTEAKASQAEAKASQAEAKASQTEAKASQAEAKANDALHHYHSVANSNSWKITKPLRIAGKGSRWFVTGANHWITFSPTSRPRRVLKQTLFSLKCYINSNPKVKIKLMSILNHFPKLKVRLKALQINPILTPIKSYQKEEDFNNINNVLDTSFKEKSLNQRDSYLSLDTIQTNLNRLIIDGHFNGTYSLASVNRNIIHRLLEENNEIELLISPREGEPISNIEIIPGEDMELKLLNSLLLNEPLTSMNDKTIQLYHHYPLVKDTDKENKSPIALFFWEESKIPADIIKILNESYIGVIVASWFIKKILIDCGCLLPINIIALPLVKPILFQKSTIDDLSRCKENNSVNLLHISSCFPRKGIDILLESFNTLCKKMHNVNLTIKTFYNPHNNTKQLIEDIVDQSYHHRINLIFDEYTDKQISDLYNNADIVVLPTRGEGLNMPAIEACTYNRPLVTTAFGAHTDFINFNNLMIPYRFEQTSSHFKNHLSVWATPSTQVLSQQLLELTSKLLNNDQNLKSDVTQLNKNMDSIFYSKNSVRSLLSALVKIKLYNSEHSEKPTKSNRKFSIVTTWEIECGIAEYSKYIVSELLALGNDIEIISSNSHKHRKVSKHLTIKKGFVQNTELNLSKLSLKGNIVWLQHHFAFFPLNINLSNNIQILQDQGKDCYITLHTSRPLLAFAQQIQKEAVICLNLFDRIFVHTINDLNNLKRLGLVENVTLIPQGIEIVNIPDKRKTSNDIYYIGSFGFLYPHKGIQGLIQAFAILLNNQQTQNLKLRLVTTVKDDLVSQNELKECQVLINKLNISEHVEWYTDFLPTSEIKELLSDLDLLVLPYQYTEESSSAASRMALSICKNVAVTPAPIFNEIRDASFTINGFNTEDIYLTIKNILEDTDKKTKSSILKKREDWIMQHDWYDIVKQYNNIFISIETNKKFLNNIQHKA